MGRLYARNDPRCRDHLPFAFDFLDIEYESSGILRRRLFVALFHCGAQMENFFKAVLHSSPILAALVWLIILPIGAMFLASRIVTGRWDFTEVHQPDTIAVALVTFAIWGLIGYIQSRVSKYYEAKDARSETR